MISTRIASLAAGAAILANATVAFAYPGQQLAARAHVSIAQARVIARKASTGTIVSQELEAEKGGSGLRYTFDIKTASGMREVGVDAKSGAILENAAEGSEAAGKDASDAAGGKEKPGN